MGFVAALIDHPVVVRNRVFGLCLGLFSFFALIWISVLTAYHDHAPNQMDVLSRTSVHVISYAIIIPPWLAFGIGLLVQASQACSNNHRASCGITVLSGVLSIVAALLAASCIFAVRRSYINTNDGKTFVAYTPLRTVLHIWTLLVAAGTGVRLGPELATKDTFAPHLRTFGICSIAVAVPACLWLATLQSYYMRPDTNRFLTRASTHFYTFVAMIPPFLAFGIGVLSQQSYNCNIAPATIRDSDDPEDARGWCSTTVSTGALLLLVALLSAATALAIQLSGAGAGLQRNVCLRRSGSEEQPRDGQVASGSVDA
ncbi:hypothetical protein D9619_009992 [Psilocybe cf. subviscida]|uniref:Uncharacterized protein n=1 Tax=Psilocybe cf. subviscida TaxID=2480587 RepID=A0A8H5BNS0_9AGAR|nr:hypothetical protein D9619_009992 [Psilocybe cf. subviscida]